MCEKAKENQGKNLESEKEKWRKRGKIQKTKNNAQDYKIR